MELTLGQIFIRNVCRVWDAIWPRLYQCYFLLFYLYYTPELLELCLPGDVCRTWINIPRPISSFKWKMGSGMLIQTKELLWMILPAKSLHGMIGHSVMRLTETVRHLGSVDLILNQRQSWSAYLKLPSKTTLQNVFLVPGSIISP